MSKKEQLSNEMDHGKAVDSKNERETFQAALSVERCAQICALSALADIIIYGLGGIFMDWEESSFLAALRTFWKVSFAYRLWQVSKIYKSVVKASGDDSSNEDQSESILKCLHTMSRAWTSSAVVITLSGSANVILAWQQRIPQVKQALILLIIAGITVAIYHSSNETQEMARQSTTISKDTIAAHIQKQHLWTNRSTALCCAALQLDALIFIPLMALSHWILDHSCHDALLTLLGISTPLTIASLLKICRQNMLQVAMDNFDEKSETIRINMKSQSHFDFALAQQEFFGELSSTFQGEMFSKMVFWVLSPQGAIGNVILSMLADKLS